MPGLELLMHNPWKTLAHRWIYTNPWLRLREDDVVRLDGTIGIYSVVVMRPSVGVLALILVKLV